MEVKRMENNKYKKIANVFSIMAILVLGVDFILETLLLGNNETLILASLITLGALILVISTIKYSSSGLAFNVPFVLLLYYTILMMVSGWKFPHYLLLCLVFCGISCIYSNFRRTVIYMIVQNMVIGFLVLRGVHVIGPEVLLRTVLIAWIACIIGDIILLLLTWTATFTLDNALQFRDSFRNLLATTENYVAILDEGNQIVYASTTLSKLAKIEEPTLTHNRPFIDLFPERSLKLLVGKMLKQKESYAEDWEFSLNGQKRYFKAFSTSMTGSSSDTLVNLYDMTYLAERDEIAVMKDSMKIGIFFMDRNYVIQDHYSRFLEELLSEENLFGQMFTDIISASVTAKELEAIKDYFGMIFERSYDQEMLDDINPMNELHYVNPRTGDRKVFQCGFATVERGKGEVFVLVTVYDITAKVELQQRLLEEENKRQEEMQSLFELIQVEPGVFNDFLEDMEYEFDAVDKTLKNNNLSAHEALVGVYQSIHAIKSNAVILGLNTFGTKVHALESKIKKLREQEEEVSFDAMLQLTMDLENLSKEREGFKTVIGKIQSYSGGSAGGRKQTVNVLIDSLVKTTDKAAADLEKKVQFVASEVEPEALDKGPRRVIKETLIQLIRNSVVHGIEEPEKRVALGKKETGIVKLTIKLVNDNVHITLTDDGNGLDYKKIGDKAVEKGLLKPEEANDEKMLTKAIFSPGFSTADTEGMHAGRGIGLNLVRDRIREAGGSIKLRSEAGRGIVFFISLPAVKTPQLQQEALHQEA
jgi:two-component system chemotaxis sensor kinase CheA